MHRLQRLLRGPGLPAGCVLAVGLAAAGSAMAEPSVPAGQALRISGFGTAGISRTSAPPGWGFQRESSQAANDGGTRTDTDSRLGLQANYTIDFRFELVGQLLLTRRLADAAASDALSWAFAAYRPTENLTVRAGRVNVNQYQLSDYRSVGLAYPFVRPPPEFYSLLPSAIDGLDATRSWRDGGGAIWRASGFYGQTKQADNRSKAYRTVRPIYGLFLSREDQGLLVKGSVSRVRLAGDVPNAAPLVAALQPLVDLPVNEVAADAAALQRPFLAGPTFDYYGVSLNLDRDDWLLLMEASHARSHGTVSVDAGYVLLGRRLGTVTPYAAFSATRARSERRRPQWTGPLTPLLGAAGAAQAQALGETVYGLATGGPKQRTASVGLRWDVSAQAALKLQYDRTRVDARGSLLWSNGSDQPGRAQVLSATFDFVF